MHGPSLFGFAGSSAFAKLGSKDFAWWENEGSLDFIKGYFAVDLSEEEFLREVRVPLRIGDSEYSSAFQKFALTHDDWAMMNCSASLAVKENGGRHSIKEARIFFGGGLAEKPVRARRTESESSSV